MCRNLSNWKIGGMWLRGLPFVDFFFCNVVHPRYFPSSRVCFTTCTANLSNAATTDVETDLISNEENGKKRGKSGKTMDKRKRSIANVVTPSLDEQRRKEVQNVMGIYLGPKAMYWAKIDRKGNVLDWNHRELFPIAEFARKIQLPKLYEMLYYFVEHIPFSDIYVLEGTSQILPSSSTSPLASATAVLRSQIIAIVVAMLNLRPETEEDASTEDELDYFHKVFLLKPRLMSRLFRLLVGTERVSALALVDSILDDSGSSTSLRMSNIMDEKRTGTNADHNSASSVKHDLPLYTPIRASPSIIESYRSLRAVEKEAMCQALLITMAFYDLTVFKDPKVLSPLQL